jgi:hypothetical protein
VDSKIDPKKLKAYSFTWVDASSDAGWKNAGEVGVHDCFALGYLVKETKDTISICGSVSDDGEYLGVISVPRKWVTKKKRVRL